jgi:hypothetical protein
MVLTRAQRAQAKVTPPESPLKASILKAPVRRGRPKKTDDEQAPKLAPKAAAAKNVRSKKTDDEPALKPASKAAAPKNAPPKSSASKASTSARVTTTKSSVAKTVASKASTMRSAAPKTLAIKTASLRASTTKKPGVVKKIAKASKAASFVAPVEDSQDELTNKQDEIEVRDISNAAEEQPQKAKTAPITVFADTSMEESAEEMDTIAPSLMTSPSRLPRPALALVEATPSSKLSILSPSKILGSIRKHPVSAALFSTPAKAANPAINQGIVDLGPSNRLNAVEEPAGLTKSPVRPCAISEESHKQSAATIEEPASIFRSPARPIPTPRPIFNQSLSKPEQAAMLFQSPVRLNTATKKIVLSHSTSNAEKPAGISQSPVRPNASLEQIAFSQSQSKVDMASDFMQSTCKRSALPFSDSVLVHPKRLRTSLSMPSLNMGSPKRVSSTQSGSPPSPVKSSLRSPEKRIVSSPKKVSWHQSPRPQTVVEEVGVKKTSGPLEGLVFFLDVNKLDGENSNQLFVPVVEELGGEWVPEWTSNSMGVTHVVFMNGELRTLEKVVATNGQVHCVNISWLLE